MRGYPANLIFKMIPTRAKFFARFGNQEERESLLGTSCDGRTDGGSITSCDPMLQSTQSNDISNKLSNKNEATTRRRTQAILCNGWALLLLTVVILALGLMTGPISEALPDSDSDALVIPWTCAGIEYLSKYNFERIAGEQTVRCLGLTNHSCSEPCVYCYNQDAGLLNNTGGTSVAFSTVSTEAFTSVDCHEVEATDIERSVTEMETCLCSKRHRRH